MARGRSRLVLVLVEETGGERAFVSRPESFPPLAGDDLEPEEVEELLDRPAAAS